MELQPLVNAASVHGTVTLSAGTYDDAEPVKITKDMLIVGPADAFVTSEFQIYGGATVEFRSFTIKQVKNGAAMATGQPGPIYPQNGQIMVHSAQLWLTDVEMYYAGGQNKPALSVVSGTVQFRAVSKWTRIMYAAATVDGVSYPGSTSAIAEAYYNSYLGFFGFDPAAEKAVALASQTASVGIRLEGSQMTMNGGYLTRWGTSGSVGINLARGSFAAIGAGAPSHIQSFPTSILEQEGSWHYVGSGSTT